MEIDAFSLPERFDAHDRAAQPAPSRHKFAAVRKGRARSRPPPPALPDPVCKAGWSACRTKSGRRARKARLG